MIKRCILLALSSFLLITSIASCGESDIAVDGLETTAGPADVTAANVSEVEIGPQINLPELDYGKKEVHIMHFGNQAATLFDSEGDNTGDVVRDAVYNRNLQTEERLNVKFVWAAGSDDWGGYPNEVHKMVLAADCPYDMFMLESSQCFRLSLEGDFQDISNLPYIDLEQPWWYTRFMNGGSISTDHRYYLTGAFSITTLEGASAAVVNKTMFNNNFGDYNDLYDLVKTEGWTHDKFTEYCAAVYNDLNGNSEKDYDDQYGFINEGQRTINYMSMSTGLTYMQRDENGLPQLDLYNDYAIKWVDILYNLIYNDYYCFSPKDGNGAPDHFSEGKSLFYVGMLSYYTSDKLRNMDIPKGVVPHPVLVEGMDYISAAGTVNGESVVLPVTTPVESREMCGAIMESLNYEAYRLVVPAWYEVALKNKYADVERDAEMIDVIYNSIDTSFIMMADKLLGTGSFFNTAVGQNKTDGGKYTSFYEKQSKSLLKNWDKMLANYDKLINQ